MSTVYCVLCIVYCVLFAVYCVLCTVYCVLYTVYCVLCTVYSVLCTLYSVLCTLYSVNLKLKVRESEWRVNLPLARTAGDPRDQFTFLQGSRTVVSTAVGKVLSSLEDAGKIALIREASS